MAIRRIVTAEDPVLRERTKKVSTYDASLHRLLDDMLPTMRDAPGVGLAANQVGIDLRLFVYDCPDDEGVRHRGVVVNPVLETSDRPETMPDPDDDLEGCLSVPGERFPTGRASWAKVTGQDASGDPVEVEGTGYFARCLQHEVDHLDGLLYLSRLTGRYARESKRMLKRNGWGKPGLSWDPAVETEPGE